MRFLPTRVHGVIDWIMGLLLIALPWLFGFARGGAETWVPVLLGLTGLIVTFFTDHEFGVVRRIPMIGHLWVDGLAGFFLAASPWLLGFSDRAWLPHLLLGLIEFTAAFVTKTVPPEPRELRVGRPGV